MKYALSGALVSAAFTGELFAETLHFWRDQNLPGAYATSLLALGCLGVSGYLALDVKHRMIKEPERPRERIYSKDSGSHGKGWE